MVEQLGPIDAQALLDDGAFLLDVREQDEWDAGHAPVATHVPLATVPAALERIPTDRPVVVICRSGRRSDEAAHWLVHQGRDARNLDGGMQAWAMVGYDVVTPAGTPGTVI